MQENTKASIDSMDYESMLSLWRNAPVGHHMFQGETGDYYSKVMAEKRIAVGPVEHTRASKSIGF